MPKICATSSQKTNLLNLTKYGLGHIWATFLKERKHLITLDRYFNNVAIEVPLQRQL
jgi:hypothetical protein